MRPLSLITFLSLLSAGAVAINDWTNPDYVLRSIKSADTSDSRNTIISAAGASAKKGPWAVSTDKSIRAPSGNPRDYLSWAPYHWPDCNWCQNSGTMHLAGGNSTNSDSGEDDGNYPVDPGYPGDDDTYDDNESDARDYHPNNSDGQVPGTFIQLEPPGSSGCSRRMIKRHRRHFGRSHGSLHVRAGLPSVPLPAKVVELAIEVEVPEDSSAPQSHVYLDPELPVSDLPVPGLASTVSSTTAASSSQTPSSTTQRVFQSTVIPAENSAQTKHSTSRSCTPSPTTHVAPSATWTTCPYITRDGKLNPDVRQLHGVGAIVDVTESVIYNALAYAFTKTANYSKNTASFINTFFLDPKTGVLPELDYGQVIRGPGKQQGQYLGILDFRGMIKVVNAVQILKALKSPDWTSALDNGMMSWAKQYANWLQNSDSGKTASTAPNNHATFYYNQVVALKMMAGDTSGASTALNSYFQHQFLDQVAKSGEQPFEAVRTRPYHYRCFNLEAMIANAKLGDQLGLNLWNAKSKYGSTIQTALDYVMGIDPKKEKVDDIFPHIAAVAAAYGDPTGKYQAFLLSHDASYKKRDYWFFDQPSAFMHSPAAAKSTKGQKGGKVDGSTVDLVDDRQEIFAIHMVNDNSNSTTDSSSPPQLDVGASMNPDVPSIPFECPDVFKAATTVQLDDGVYVTCDELKPFYGYLS